MIIHSRKKASKEVNKPVEESKEEKILIPDEEKKEEKKTLYPKKGLIEE